MSDDKYDPVEHGGMTQEEHAAQYDAVPDVGILRDFTRAIVVKAVIDTFTELIASCEGAEPETGVITCTICRRPVDVCDPGCQRLRAERALALLLGGGVRRC